MPLDVLVSGLLSPLDAPPEMRALRLPALEKWLARAEVSRNDASTAHQWLAAAFSLPSPPPYAAVALFAEREDARGSWVSADPVHVRVDRNRTSMHAGAILGIEVEEAALLVDALNRHFHSDALEFVAPSPGRWYLRVPAEDVPLTKPLEEALREDARKLVPAARGKVKWPAVLTEIQMILAVHEVNVSREQAGKPVINSVWLWGGGEQPAQVPARYAGILADDSFARGLARITEARHAETPRQLAQLTPDAGGDTLAFDDSALRAAHRGDAPGWCDAARKLDAEWFAHLGGCITRFAVVRVILPSPAGTLVARLTAAARWRLLRTRRAIASYA